LSLAGHILPVMASPFGLSWLLGGVVLTDSRAGRRDWPGGQASGMAFLEHGPLPCGENPADWAVRVGVVTADRSGGHGVRQQSSQRRVGGGNTVNRVDYRLPDGNARSFVYRAGHARAAAETGRRAHLVQQRLAFGRQFRGPAGVHP
jgi:hypothetical protein